MLAEAWGTPQPPQQFEVTDPRGRPGWKDPLGAATGLPPAEAAGLLPRAHRSLRGGHLRRDSAKVTLPVLGRVGEIPFNSVNGWKTFTIRTLALPKSGSCESPADNAPEVLLSHV